MIHGGQALRLRSPTIERFFPKSWVQVGQDVVIRASCELAADIAMQLGAHSLSLDLSLHLTRENASLRVEGAWTRSDLTWTQDFVDM